MPIDHVLKLYSESVRSPYLHYGFWDNPESVNASEFTLNEMVKAQGRYIEHLVSFIPEDVKTVLDVGAGIGGNSSYLLSKGYEVHNIIRRASIFTTQRIDKIIDNIANLS